MCLTLTLRGLMFALSLSLLQLERQLSLNLLVFGQTLAPELHSSVPEREKSRCTEFVTGLCCRIFCNLHIMYLFLIYPLSNQSWPQIAEQDGFSWTSSPRWWGGTTECQYLHDRGYNTLLSWLSAERKNKEGHILPAALWRELHWNEGLHIFPLVINTSLQTGPMTNSFL